MSECKIRSARMEELPQCLDTIHRAFSVNCERFGLTKENYPTCAAFMTIEELVAAKESGTHVYAAWVDGTVAGCVQITRGENDVYLFKRFAVLPEYQHLGLGRKLISHCRRKAREYGGKKLRLLMIYENEQLRNLYLSSGFELVETRRDDAHPFLCGIFEMDVTRSAKTQ